MTATFTTDFREEFEAERSRWLRRRFLWYCGVLFGLGVLSTLGALFGYYFTRNLPAAQRETAPALLLIATFGNLIASVLYAWSFLHVRRRLLGRDAILRLVYWLIVVIGLISFATNVAGLELGAANLRLNLDQPAESSAAPPPIPAEAAPADATPADAAPEEAAPVDPDSAANRTLTLSPTPGMRLSVADDGQAAAEPGAPASRADQTLGAAIGALSNIFATHFFACLFLPWTPRESIRPLIPLFIVNSLIVLIYVHGFLTIVLLITLSPLLALPGAAICWWRHSRFRQRFHYAALRGRYGEMRRELVDAQRIHEALFPAPIKSGAVRFDFRYEPMRQIGGDFLFAHRFTGGDLTDSPSGANAASTSGGASPSSSPSSLSDQEPLSIVIIDVTGHGIPAALTVNRLHGELMRIFSEEPDISPGDVLASLNRYVHFTLATHSVYATALCLRVDPARDLLQWASGGHPPAFLRTVDGRIDRLDSTAFVLGACHGADFKSNEQSFHFSKGDTLIAYTDGATEARDARGQMLRVEGIQRLIAGAQPRSIAEGGWSGAVLHAVDEHRFGPPADDTLLVEIWRPVTP